MGASAAEKESREHRRVRAIARKHKIEDRGIASGKRRGRGRGASGCVVLTEHAPVLEEAEETDDFLMGLGGSLELDDGTVRTDDPVGGQDQERRGNTDEDDDQERLR